MALGEQFATVLRAAQSGAEWAIAALYRDLQPNLLGYLRSQQPGDAEDLASEVWMNVASGIGRFEGNEAAFRGWLFTIARRRLIDLRRRSARRQTDVVPVDALAERPASDDAEQEVLAGLTTRRALDRVVRILSAEQAEVVLLRLVAGLPVEEVATIVGKRPGAVRALQHRALVRLARELAPEGITE